ncbi:hypothetical protein O4214_30060 [Rhodococcus erythropolis]|uniref:hypothetical protein n=1 Tax=Rhodococcus erythropolis TaxID=1833 RepID=UPI001E32EEB7|nr:MULTISPECIES: hypothetical protein [Rhodococcus erythropolis group]MCD2109311.1 hypothetical protein [Rhodococcus qingshengii]MCZ4528235.1 hypothetical protein [Rhodococcus erythropolis]
MTIEGWDEIKLKIKEQGDLPITEGLLEAASPPPLGATNSNEWNTNLTASLIVAVSRLEMELAALRRRLDAVEPKAAE